MTTIPTSRTLSVAPLIEMHNPAFAHAYQQGMQWMRFEQQEHRGPLFDSDITETLSSLARTGIFDEEHEPALYEYLGSYFGMIHEAVLSTQGTIAYGVSTLIQLGEEDVRDGYHAGREFFFLEAECDQERTLSDDGIIERLRELLHDAARSQNPKGVFDFCVGCLLGRLVGTCFLGHKPNNRRGNTTVSRNWATSVPSLKHALLR